MVVAITGANDAASIVVDATVTDDRATVEAGAAGSGDPNASGKLTVSDVDDGEAAFAAPASLNGIYGSFTFNAASGSWTYTLDNNRAATQALNQGDAVSDTLSVSSLDGTASHNIVVAITWRQRCGFDRRRCDGHRRSGDGRGGCGRQRRSECLRQADGQRCRRRRGGVCRPGLPQRHLWQLHLQCRQRQLDLYARQ
ncbi:VCBS domain-containing protein [Rhizobium ruizarguesonis]|uniref:VCBS domain-containing protein n=1 Tax=Rhizobium ruizarguesonis TaxID=2081791 RepID=UPI0039C894D4